MTNHKSGVPSYGCVIGEMGVRDHNDKPYPSTGFTSVYVMAHEIGHNLGRSSSYLLTIVEYKFENY